MEIIEGNVYRLDCRLWGIKKISEFSKVSLKDKKDRKRGESNDVVLEVNDGSPTFRFLKLYITDSLLYNPLLLYFSGWVEIAFPTGPQQRMEIHKWYFVAELDESVGNDGWGRIFFSSNPSLAHFSFFR